MPGKMKEQLKKLQGLKSSWAVYYAAMLLAAPELLAFLPTVKEHIPPEVYSWVFRVVVILFVLLRIKTQLRGSTHD
jgi:hypothetical protein